MKKRNIFKVLALLCVLVLVVGSIPVSAAKLKTIMKRINKGISAEEEGTIRITTKAAGTIVVHSDKNSSNKKLYINAPNAKVVNYAQFEIISIKACKKYVEKGKDNDLKVIGSSKIQITPGGQAGSINVNTKAPVEIVIGEGAEVEAVKISKAGANVDIATLDGAAVDIIVNKKANVALNGENSDIMLFNNADGTVVEVNTKADIVTNADIKTVYGANADGSTIDAANDIIVVDVENPQNTAVTLLINGEVVNNEGQGTGSGSAITVEGV